MAADAITVGIDVCKHHLDVHLEPDQPIPSRRQLTTRASLELIAWLAHASPDCIVVESTGGYERNVLYGMLHAQLPVAMVNPRPVRRLRQGPRHARQDRSHRCARPGPLRTAMSPFASAKSPRSISINCGNWSPVAVNSSSSASPAATSASMSPSNSSASPSNAPSIISRPRSPPSNPPSPRPSTRAMNCGNAAPSSRPSRASAPPPPGPGHRTARTGNHPRQQIAALVGVAPFNDDSGNAPRPTPHPRRTPTVRAALYMATLVAARHNPVIRTTTATSWPMEKPRRSPSSPACANSSPTSTPS